MSIKRNIELIERELAAKGCRLIAVSKNQPAERIQEAYDAGHRAFGENKVQEMVAKYEGLPQDIQWHFIGHLQSNKVKYIAPFVHLIHSVDSKKLLEEINKQGKKLNRTIPCLLQIYIAREESKFGFSKEELMDLIHSPSFRNHTHVSIQGLMGMATLTSDKDQIRNEFRSLRLLAEELRTKALPSFVQLRELSMGMSSDYPIALTEGSTFVRIGTTIFGERNYYRNDSI